ncbi:MAG: right-handed parallel beta-helix repeat-containing protein, partial [Planctomycetota bacterium]
MKRAFIATAILAVLATTASADTLLVPKDFDTIQAAVDAAGDGDVIKVKKGTWTTPVHIQDKTNLTIIGAGGPSIVAGAAFVGFTVDECVGITIKGFRFQSPQERGIVVTGSDDVTIEKCRIDGATKDGIATSDCTLVTITKCRIANCGVNGISLSAAQGELEVPTEDSTVSKCRISMCDD